jgi:hypothetical protein
MESVTLLVPFFLFLEIVRNWEVSMLIWPVSFICFVPLSSKLFGSNTSRDYGLLLLNYASEMIIDQNNAFACILFFCVLCNIRHERVKFDFAKIFASLVFAFGLFYASTVSIPAKLYVEALPSHFSIGLIDSMPPAYVSILVKALIFVATMGTTISSIISSLKKIFCRPEVNVVPEEQAPPVVIQQIRNVVSEQFQELPVARIDNILLIGDVPIQEPFIRNSGIIANQIDRPAHHRVSVASDVRRVNRRFIDMSHLPPPPIGGTPLQNMQWLNEGMLSSALDPIEKKSGYVTTVTTVDTDVLMDDIDRIRQTIDVRGVGRAVYDFNNNNNVDDTTNKEPRSYAGKRDHEATPIPAIVFVVPTTDTEPRSEDPPTIEDHSTTEPAPKKPKTE